MLCRGRRESIFCGLGRRKIDNKGVDGVTPLIAGICSKEQEKTVVKAPEISRGTVVPGWNLLRLICLPAIITITAIGTEVSGVRISISYGKQCLI